VYEKSRRGLNAKQAATVERLLEAGEEELAQVGPDALTIRTVALRAGVSSATAYTYLASKDHLAAELFWRHLSKNPSVVSTARSATTRLQELVRFMAGVLAGSPQMAEAATRALLGSDPDVDRLRATIGLGYTERFRQALLPIEDDEVLEALTLAFSGAMLQAGMGFYTYSEMGARLDAVVAVIMKGIE
jgi:AcrR family transcriptional regulator